ncbi:MAG: LamG-like jellyroll fold domain-containing protein, partial [Pirellula sp.]
AGAFSFGSSTDFPLNVFHHIVVSYNSTTRELAVYRDGVLFGQVVTSVSVVPNLGEGRLGAWESSTGVFQRQYNGNLDDFAIYDRVLTAAEIEARFAARLLSVAVASTTSIIPAATASNFVPADNEVYTLRIDVSDKDGAMTSSERTFTVVNVAPTINDLNTTGPVGASASHPVSFGTYSFNAGDVTDPGVNDVRTYLWEVTTNNGQQILTSDAFAFTIWPQFAGDYTVKLTVTDSDGSSSVFSQVINVNPIAVISLPASPTAGSVLTIDSDHSSLLAPAGGLNGTTLSATRTYAWTVTLGVTTIATGTSSSVDFVPAVAGNYNVALTINDNFFNNAVLTSTRSHTVNSALVVTAPAAVTIDTLDQTVAPDFDGVNDRIDLGVLSTLGNLSNHFSVVAWVKPDSLTGTRRVLAGGTWRLGLQGSEIALEINTSAGSVLVTSTGAGLKAGVWNHIAALRRSDNSIEFFVNGRSLGTSSGPIAQLLPSGPWHIGSLNVTGVFDGMIRDVGVFNSVLTTGQLDAVRDGNISSPVPLSFWRMNEGVGTTVANSGTLTIPPATMLNGLTWAKHSDASEGDVLTFDLGSLPPVDEFATRVVVWSVTPASFTIIPTDDQQQLRIRVNADGLFTISATITDTYTNPAFSTTNFVRVANKANVSVANQAAFIAVDDLFGDENSTVTLIANVTDAGLTDTHTFSIVWGDGSPNSTGSVVGGIVSATKTFAQDGSYQATLTVTDNAGAARTQALTIVIGNVAPVGVNDSGITTNEETDIVLLASTLLSNDTDAGTLDVLSIDSLQSISTLGAIVSFDINGNVHYDPRISSTLQGLRQGQSLLDTFTYIVTDDAGATSTATVTVTVNGSNDSPIARPDNNAVIEGQTLAVSGNLLANDTDLDLGTTLTVLEVDTSNVSPISGQYGTLTWTTNGNYTYQLDNANPAVQRLAAGQTIIDDFEYFIFDGVENIESTLTIAITGINDAPAATADSNSVIANSVLAVQSSQFDNSVLFNSPVPVAYWRLNDVGGTVTANRLAPTTPDGTYVGTPVFGQPSLVANSTDTSVRFDGTTHISIPDSSLINTYVGSANAKTIELWFSAENVQARQVLYEQGNAAQGLNVYIDASELYFGTWNANVFGPIVKAAISTDTRYHVVAVFGSSTARLYLNGVQVASGATPFSSIANHAGDSAIGGARTTRFHNATTGNGSLFTGKIDEVVLYNSELQSFNVAAHYRAAGLLANDRDVDSADTMAVSAVNGNTAAVGQFVDLPSGARLKVELDGSYTYDPNRAFDYLPTSVTANDTFTYTILDASGASSTATVTITVGGINDAPQSIELSSNRITNSNIVGNLSAFDVDLGDIVTFQLEDDSEAPGAPNFALVGNQLVVVDRSGFVLGQTRVLTLRGSDIDGDRIFQVIPLTVTEIAPTVGVTSATPNPSGVDFAFSTPMDLSVLNIYDGVDIPVDVADVTLVGASTGNVRGSLLLDAATNTMRFVKTGSPLAADTYTLTLFSNANGFKSTTGELLDGDADGTPGGNFVATFGVTNSTARVVSIPDFARGATSTAGQNVNLSFDNGNPGLPVTISDGNDVLAVNFDVVFNPTMINLSSTFFNVLPLGWSTTVNLLSSNRMRLSLSGSTPLGAGPQIITRLLGSVPANVAYGASDLVRVENLSVFTLAGGAMPVPSISDAGIHKAVFIGDTNADGLYTAQDSGWISGVAVSATTGFDAFSWTDPIIVADVTQNGSIEGLDAAWITRKGLSSALQPEIPNLPAGSL